MLGITLSGTAPIYEQLVTKIEQLVLGGVLEENEQLPSVRELACELAVNPNTIQKAYAYLEQEGVTYSVNGKGRFVTNDVSSLKEKRIGVLLFDLRRTAGSLMQLGAQAGRVKDEIDKVYAKGETK